MDGCSIIELANRKSIAIHWSKRTYKYILLSDHFLPMTINHVHNDDDISVSAEGWMHEIASLTIKSERNYIDDGDE